MQAVGVTGHSDAGKTTLIERLVATLRDRGRVATVKAIHHDIEVDEPGKDTHRHRTAGAEKVIGITPALTFSVAARGRADYPDDAAALAALLGDLRAEDFEYVLIEGFSATPVPRIAVGAAGDTDTEPAGPVLARVEAVDSADIDRLVGLIEAADPWAPP